MKDAITTLHAPGAIGPYSQAVRARGFLFVSGQIPLDPATGQLVVGDISAQTERVMKNLGAVLSSATLGFDDVVRTTIYLVDLGHFATVNEVYGRFFRAPYPARSTVQVAALPRGVAIEIDAIAVAGEPSA
ncbi:MAG TPA: RidA family protein [Polyangiaceae bacterium]|nr:RidA family protein [Polyangiaceae bacterium]